MPSAAALPHWPVPAAAAAAGSSAGAAHPPSVKWPGTIHRNNEIQNKSMTMGDQTVTQSIHVHPGKTVLTCMSLMRSRAPA